MKTYKIHILSIIGVLALLTSCGNNNGKNSSNGALNSSAAEKMYVAPGEQRKPNGVWLTIR